MLNRYPDTQMVSRDGSKSFAKAITDASPNIIQVADRWHILHQLFEAVKKEVYSILPAKWIPNRSQEVMDDPLPSGRKSEQARTLNEEARWSRIRAVQAMARERRTVASIARELSISRGTVYADLKIRSRPTHQRRSRYDSYRNLVRELVERELTGREIEAVCRVKGYEGSVSTLNTMIAEERRIDPSSKRAVYSFRQKVLQVIWDFKNKEHASCLQDLHPELLKEFPELLKLDELVLSFRSLFIRKARDGLRKWLCTYKDVDSPYITSFIEGLRQDIKAVWHGIVQPWSNGPVEGQVNRLKMIKRMMYGRAGFKLLRSRFLYQW